MTHIIKTFTKDPGSISTNKEAGHGAFAHVFLTPCETYAVKRCSFALCDGWLLYAAAILALPERKRLDWMPRIHSIHVDVENDSYVALMDRLDEYGHQPPDDMPRDGYIDEYDLDDEDDENITTAGEDYLESIEFLQRIDRETGVDLFYDIHTANIMLCPENGGVIINDPVCMRKWGQQMDDGPLHADTIIPFLKKCAESSKGKLVLS